MSFAASPTTWSKVLNTDLWLQHQAWRKIPIPAFHCLTGRGYLTFNTAALGSNKRENSNFMRPS